MNLTAKIVTVLAAMLGIKSVMADQASLVTRLKDNPTENFSALDEGDLLPLAEADAMVYFQSRMDLAFDLLKAMDFGTAHAFKHGLMGGPASTYSNRFVMALKALTAKE